MLIVLGVLAAVLLICFLRSDFFSELLEALDVVVRRKQRKWDGDEDDEAK